MPSIYRVLRRGLVLLCFGGIAVLPGCTGTQSFGVAARAGDTVMVALGWNLPFSRQDISVEVRGESGSTPYTFAPGDPSVRFLGRLYPDPASRLLVGGETNQSLGVQANAQARQLQGTITSGDRDYAQTVLVLNLPATLPAGTATIRVLDMDGSPLAPDVAVQVLPGKGSAHDFAGPGGNATAALFAGLERASDVKTVTFSTSGGVPYALQVDLLRQSGTGTPWLVNPRGDLKALSWSDDGTRIRVLLTPANSLTPDHIMNFKFLVGGGLSGLSVDGSSIKAVDSSGNPVVGIAARLQ